MAEIRSIVAMRRRWRRLSDGQWFGTTRIIINGGLIWTWAELPFPGQGSLTWSFDAAKALSEARPDILPHMGAELEKFFAHIGVAIYLDCVEVAKKTHLHNNGSWDNPAHHPDELAKPT